MNDVMGDYIDDFVLVYLDDKIVYSIPLNMNINIISDLYSTELREQKLQAKLKKCEFGKPCVKYLGHIVGSGEVHVDQDKLAAVSN